MKLLFACVWLVAGCGFKAEAHLPADATGAGGDPVPEGATRFVQGHSGLTPSSATSVAAAFLQPQAASNLNVVVISWAGDGKLVGVADSAGNAYTRVDVANNDTIYQATFYAADIRAAAANTVSAAFSSGVFNPTIRIVEYAGIATAQPVDETASDTGTGAIASSSDVDLTNAHDLVFAANTSDRPTTAPGDSFTSRMIFYGAIVEDREVTAPGTYEANATIGDAQANWIMTVVGFKALR